MPPLGGMPLEMMGMGATPPPSAGMSPMPGQKEKKSFGERLSQLLPFILGGAGAVMAGKEGVLGDAVAGFGQGFASGKLDQALEKRQRKHAQEDAMTKRAHEVLQELEGLDITAEDGVTPTVVADLKQLSQKHKEALMNDNVISPKEAADILSFSQLIQPSIAAAKAAQSKKNQATEAVGKERAETAALGENVFQAGKFRQPQGQMTVPGAGGGQGFQMNMPPQSLNTEGAQRGEANRVAAGMRYEQNLAQQPVDIGDGQLMDPRQASSILRAREQGANRMQLQRSGAVIAQRLLSQRLGARASMFDAATKNRIIMNAVNAAVDFSQYNQVPFDEGLVEQYLEETLASTGGMFTGAGGGRISPPPMGDMKPPQSMGNFSTQMSPKQVADTIRKQNRNLNKFTFRIGGNQYIFDNGNIGIIRGR